MRPIVSLLAILLTTWVVNAAPSKPSVADQIRHPRGGNRWPAAIVRPPVSGSSASRSVTRIATKACPQLRRMIAETSWTAARKFRASLS